MILIRQDYEKRMVELQEAQQQLQKIGQDLEARLAQNQRELDACMGSIADCTYWLNRASSDEAEAPQKKELKK